MHFLALLSTLVAGLAASVIAGPAAPPQFEVIFFGTYELGDIGTIDRPLGTRVHAVVNGANFTDPSGKLVATLLPTVDTGVISKSGIFHPEAALGVRWEVDGKLAYQKRGSSIFANNLEYVHLETDSDTWSGLNSRFLVANVSGPSNAPIYTLFGAE